MKRIKVGDMVESDYGRGKVLAVTNQWIIHDNSLNDQEEEFAILISDDHLRVIEQEKVL